jgi:uncharacterized protein (TIGR03000 family)
MNEKAGKQGVFVISSERCKRFPLVNGGAMSRTLPSLSPGLVVLISPSPGQARIAPAHVVVTLSGDAHLHVEGQTGASRTFASPPLQPGVSCTSPFTALSVRAGTPIQTRSIHVRASETTNVDFASLGAGDEAPLNAPGWPREYTEGADSRRVLHQPRLGEWGTGLGRWLNRDCERRSQLPGG